MKLKNIYRLAFVLLFVSAIASCSKTQDNAASPSGDARDKLVGSWTSDETSKVSGKSSYTVTISKDVTSGDGIIMKNFYQLGNTTSTFGSFDGSNITIPQQSVSGYSIKGSGLYNSNNTMNFSYTTNDGQKTDSVTALFHH